MDARENTHGTALSVRVRHVAAVGLVEVLAVPARLLGACVVSTQASGERGEERRTGKRISPLKLPLQTLFFGKPVSRVGLALPRQFQPMMSLSGPEVRLFVRSMGDPVTILKPGGKALIGYLSDGWLRKR